MWADLYAGGVDVALAAHDHDYERFVPLDAGGRPDDTRGVREFVVGTGGVGLHPFKATVAGSAVKQHNTLGVLALTLQPAGYKWSFRPVGNAFTTPATGSATEPAVPNRSADHAGSRR